MKLKYLSTGHNDLSVSYLFIETIVSAGILSEAAQNRFAQTMQTAISKLQNFFTPGASSDLETMLGFFAPKGGGLAKVREMVQKAGALQTQVTQDQNWWQELFTVFNIQDPAVQQQIKGQTAKSAGDLQPAQPATTQPTAAPQAPNAVSSNLKDQIDKNTAARQASAARIKETQAKIAALKAKQGSVQPGAEVIEGVMNILASKLLQEADVKSNLKFVGNNLMRRLGYASITTTQETNWLKKFVGEFGKNRPVEEGFRDFFRDFRTMAANPGHLAAKQENSQLKDYNERVAKLAIKHLSDYMTSEFNSRLQVANLNSRDMISIMAEWQKCQAAYQQIKSNSGTVPAGLLAKTQAAYTQLQRVLFALDPNLAKGTSA